MSVRKEITSSYEGGQCGSKSTLKTKRTLTHLNTAAFLIHKCGKDNRKPHLRYNTQGLIVTLRFCFRKADNLGVVLTELLSVAAFLQPQKHTRQVVYKFIYKYCKDLQRF